jgi:hypothetical protein
MAALPERTPVNVNEFRNNFKLHRSILHKNVVEFGTDPRRIRIKREIVESFMPLIHEIVNKSIPKGDTKLAKYDATKLKVEDVPFGGFELQYEKLPRLVVGPSLHLYRDREAEEAKDYPIHITIAYRPLPAVSSKLDEAKKMVAEAKRDAREKLFTTNAEPIADAIVAKIKSFPPPVQRRITPEATTAVPNTIQAEERRYKTMSQNWNMTLNKNKALFESFGVEVDIEGHQEDVLYTAMVKVGPTEQDIKMNPLYFTQPFRTGMYARLFGLYYNNKEGGDSNHIVGGFITTTHVVVLHHYIEGRNTTLEKEFKRFVQEELRKTYVVHPPGSGYDLQSADLRVQDKGACQRWYVMLPYTIAKYIAVQRPLAAQTPEQLAKTAENWTKIGDWAFVKPVYDSVNRNPLKCWGDVVLENKLTNIGGKTRRRMRKRKTTRRR